MGTSEETETKNACRNNAISNPDHVIVTNGGRIACQFKAVCCKTFRTGHFAA